MNVRVVALLLGGWCAGPAAANAPPAVATNVPPATPPHATSAAVAHAPSDADADLNEVMVRLERRMAGIRSVQADFIQKKALSLLADVVTIEGRMALEGDRFAWHVDTPVKYSLVVEGAVARQWDEETRRVRRDSLAGNPVFQSVNRQLGHWFSGRYSALLKEYRAAVVAGAPDWRLRFEPIAGTAAAKAVREVAVAFREDGRYIQRIEIVDQSGDRTSIEFSNVRVNEEVPPQTWQVERR
jgi:outer membrane lipoprotein-sorting protein